MIVQNIPKNYLELKTVSLSDFAYNFKEVGCYISSGIWPEIIEQFSCVSSFVLGAKRLFLIQRFICFALLYPEIESRFREKYFPWMNKVIF